MKFDEYIALFIIAHKGKMVSLILFIPKESLFRLIYLFIYCGTGDGTQGHSTSKLHPQPYFILLF